MSETVRLVAYDRSFLDRSWDWLGDPEIKALTMTPDFTREDQQLFFDALPGRRDYHIWGVALADGRPIGAAGIKHVAGKSGEYWGYIGERDCWGRGLGAAMLGAVEAEARALGIETLYLKVARNNVRAVALYVRAGYRPDDPDSDVLVMRRLLETK